MWVLNKSIQHFENHSSEISQQSNAGIVINNRTISRASHRTSHLIAAKLKANSLSRPTIPLTLLSSSSCFGPPATPASPVPATGHHHRHHRHTPPPPPSTPLRRVQFDAKRTRHARRFHRVAAAASQQQPSIPRSQQVPVPAPLASRCAD